MYSFNHYNLLLQILDLAEAAENDEMSTYIVENFIKVLDPRVLNEATGNAKLKQAVANLAQKARTMADQAGGHHLQNMKSIFTQAADSYAHQTGDSQTPKQFIVLIKKNPTGMMASLTAILLLGSAMAGSEYGPEKAKQTVALAAQEFGVADVQGPAEQGQHQAPQQMESINEEEDQKPELVTHYVDDEGPVIRFNGDAIPKLIMWYAKKFKKEHGSLTNAGVFILKKAAKMSIDPKQISQIMVDFNKSVAFGVLCAVEKYGVDKLTPIISALYKVAKSGMMESLTEGNSLDLMHLPADAVAWLYDRPEQQMKAAKEIGIAAKEVGNPIAHGGVLRADNNVLILHDTHNKGKFHVYPDGSISFNGEIIDGHEDVEKHIGVTPEKHEADIQDVEPEHGMISMEVHPEHGEPGMENFAGMMAPQEDEYEDHPMDHDHMDAMESLSWDDIVDEGKTAEKFKQLKHKVMKHNPRAKTPKLDHVIDLWDQVDA